MTPLENRLIDDMKFFGYTKCTKETWLLCCPEKNESFPNITDQITNEQLREYQLWHKDKYEPRKLLIFSIIRQRIKRWLFYTKSGTAFLFSLPLRHNEDRHLRSSLNKSDVSSF